MLTKLASRFLVLHCLEQRPEDSRADVSPVEPARVEELGTHLGVERRDADGLRENAAVGIRKFLQSFIEMPRFDLLIKHLEEHRNLRAEVGAVVPSPVLDEFREQVAIPETRVVGIHAEQYPDEED
ncbi:hypothetical protein E3T37_12650 [Cryobacterium sp. TMT2-10]|nr:hypothetical protein E3T37_12650 [Cryobacterium sp. TMT2-10]